MTTGHPLGDFMHALLQPSATDGQLVFDEAGVQKLRARFMAEAHKSDANEAGSVVLTAIGLLKQLGQTIAMKQLVRVLVETVEAVQSELGDGRFDEFLGHVRATGAAFSEHPPEGSQKANTLAVPMKVRC